MEPALPFFAFIFFTKIVSGLGNYVYQEDLEFKASREKSVPSLIFDDYFASSSVEVEDDFLLVEIEA